MATAHRTTAGLRVVAVFEAAKGAIVLVAGFGLLTTVHEGLAQAIDGLVQHLHLNPANGYPHVFIDLMRQASQAPPRLLAAGALVYAALRLAEGYGLWHQRQWAAWYSVATGGVYVPIELYELARGFSTLKLAALLLNVGVVAYMGYALRVSRQRQRGATGSMSRTTASD